VSDRPIRIAVDVPGGDPDDRGISHEVRCLEALSEIVHEAEGRLHILAVGDKEKIERCVPSQIFKNIETIHSPEVFPMDGTVNSHGRKETSIKTCGDLVKKGLADVLYSSGNSAGTVFNAHRLGKLAQGFSPSLVKEMPSGLTELCYVNDVGANKDSQPTDLLVSALLTKMYAQVMHGESTIPIGMFKAPVAEKAMPFFDRLQDFIGFVKPENVYEGIPKVLALDGFMGNVYLKVVEATARAMKDRIKKAGLWQKLFEPEAIFTHYFSPENCCATRAQFKTSTGTTYLLASGETPSDAAADAQNAMKHHLSKGAHVGVLSNGEESSKGNKFAQELLTNLHETEKQNAFFHAIGFVEPKDMFEGIAKRENNTYHVNLLATDKWTAEIYSQTILALEKALNVLISDNYSWTNLLLRKLHLGKLYTIKKLLDPDNYGSAPVLGVDGYAVVNHGLASRKAIKTGILFAERYVRSGYIAEAKKAIPDIQKILSSAKIPV